MKIELDALLLRVRIHLTESAAIQSQAAKLCAESVADAARTLASSLAAGGKALICGNGGSAADSQHLAAELMGSMRKDFPRPGLAAIALTTDTSFLTAFSNDSGYDQVFERQVRTLGRPEDVLIAISTSGESPNILYAVEAARDLGLKTIALTGSKGRLATKADIAILVPSADTQYIQETHIALEHALCDLVERLLFGDSPVRADRDAG